MARPDPGHSARKPTGAITFVARLLCRASKLVSLSTWCRIEASERGIHAYVAAWLVILSVLLTVWPTSGAWGLAAVAVAFYRLQDLLFSTLDDALHLTGQRFAGFDYRTPVLIALVNITSVVLVFAIAYLELTGKGAFSNQGLYPGRFGYFFLSWISLPPLGGGAQPATVMSQALSVTEEATGLLIVVIALTRFLSKPG